MLNALVLSSLFLGSLAIFDVEVLEERDVYTLTPPNNGSGPMWSGGCTSIAAIGEDVYVSEMQTGEGVPLLSNTRWRLLERTPDGFKCVAEPEGYRQREPCSLAVADGKLFMYVNDSIMPPGTMYGACEPHLLKFKLDEPVTYETLMPKWAGAHTFTDHSYRGYAADAAAGRLLMLNIDAKTSVENACMLDTAGNTLATGSITFPIRGCYPQVALIGDAVHAVAVGDIVEPVEEWRKFKFEKTQREWDYVFRILYYARTPNLREQNFGAPLEIANVDKTAGYIGHRDLWIAPNGDAWIIYSEQEVQSALLRDKFFPGKSLIPSLYAAVVRGNEIVERRTIVAGTDGRACSEAKIHVLPDGTPVLLVNLTGKEPGMYLRPLMDEKAGWTKVALTKPFGAFSLASWRAGNSPSDTVDIFGPTNGNVYSYAQVRVKTGE
ncbi:MAG TPA: hypothetical protein VMZ06_09270 [Candidatus Bathyarchaeia archaeon]|nr:hypothetical protein [Candidatus Bathyarchaeia archaeon]